jgi:hypothetical protein
LPRVTVAVVETPHTAFVGGQCSGKRDAHAVIARRKIDLAFAVTVAEFEQPARTIDAQPLDHIARPAAAVALFCQPPLGRQHAIAARRFDVALEVGLVAEEPKPVLDVPLDARRTARSRLGAKRLAATGKHEQEDKQKAWEHSVCRDQTTMHD